MLTIEAKRAVFFGDWHGDLGFASTALQEAYNTLQPDVYFHVGDFGFWPQENEECWQPEYLPGLERFLAAQGKTLYFVDGNHEQHKWLATFPIDENGLRPISEHIIHIPRGAALMVGSKKLVGFGGARSIDRSLRVLDESWFLEEMITQEDLDRALENVTADILLTHERPFEGNSGRTMDFLSKIDAEQQRRFVMTAAERLDVKLLVHGHHHHRYTSTDFQFKIEGLGCNDHPMTPEGIIENRVVVEVA